MSQMILCPNCSRHLHAIETSCPFCGAALTEAQRRPQREAVMPGGTSRGAAYAARVALLAGTTALACNGGTTAADAHPDVAQADTSGDRGTIDSAGSGGVAGGQGGSTDAAAGTGGAAGGFVADAGPSDAGTAERSSIPLPYGTVWPPEPVEV
jgi:hypothetical protein